MGKRPGMKGQSVSGNPENKEKKRGLRMPSRCLAELVSYLPYVGRYVTEVQMCLTVTT